MLLRERWLHRLGGFGLLVVQYLRLYNFIRVNFEIRFLFVPCRSLLIYVVPRSYLYLESISLKTITLRNSSNCHSVLFVEQMFERSSIVFRIHCAVFFASFNTRLLFLSSYLQLFQFLARNVARCLLFKILKRQSFLCFIPMLLLSFAQT